MSKRFYAVIVACAMIISTFMACNSKPKAPKVPLKDDELSSFMLGGIYFVYMNGGMGDVDALLTGADDDEAVVKRYRELFILPYTDKEDCRKLLSEGWDVHNKKDLLEILDDLKNHKLKSSTNKAWDYARMVNNVCQGYLVGYITAEEGKKILAEVLPLARKEFATWDAYYADYIAGLKAWDNSNTPDNRQFDKLSKEITKGDKSIYKLLPLNPAPAKN